MLDRLQAGQPRTVTVVGVGVERIGAIENLKERGMDTASEFVTIAKTETRLSTDKQDSQDFVAGSKVHRSVAQKFGLVNEGLVVLARPVDEVPDLAVTELEARGLPVAPENRALAGSPENKGKKS